MEYLNDNFIYNHIPYIMLNGMPPKYITFIKYKYPLSNI